MARTYGSKTERERQANVAALLGRGLKFTFLCADDEVFTAVAMTEAGARRVLNAERPGVVAELAASEPSESHESIEGR